MTKEQLIYNDEYIHSIATKYKYASDTIESIINELYYSGAKFIFENNYKGHASEIATELFNKITEHLRFLKMCCDNTNEYIIDSLETMKELDKSILSNKQ